MKSTGIFNQCVYAFVCRIQAEYIVNKTMKEREREKKHECMGIFVCFLALPFVFLFTVFVYLPIYVLLVGS